MQGVRLTASSRNMIVTAAAKEMDAPASVASVRSLQGSGTSHCIGLDQPSMLLSSMACVCCEGIARHGYRESNTSRSDPITVHQCLELAYLGIFL